MANAIYLHETVFYKSILVAKNICLQCATVRWTCTRNKISSGDGDGDGSATVGGWNLAQNRTA